MNIINRDEQFQQDLNSAIYDAISGTVSKYSDMITDTLALRAAVNCAVLGWESKYFESDICNG